MSRAIEDYLARVLIYANRPAEESRRIREALRDHLTEEAEVALSSFNEQTVPPVLRRLDGLVTSKWAFGSLLGSIITASVLAATTMGVVRRREHRRVVSTS
jgi:hypothetical protein